MVKKIEDSLTNISTRLKNEKIVEMPKWANFVKTGVNRERVPQQLDWWYSRAASMLRKIYLHGPIGAERLSKFYGGRKNRGYKPERFKRGSRKIIRTILQQLEEKNLVKKLEKQKRGRIITEEGKKYLN